MCLGVYLDVLYRNIVLINCNILVFFYLIQFVAGRCSPGGNPRRKDICKLFKYMTKCKILLSTMYGCMAQTIIYVILTMYVIPDYK